MRVNKKKFAVLIILLVLLTKSVSGVICKFCKNELIPLERHTLPCETRVTQSDENIPINYQLLPLMQQLQLKMTAMG